MLNYQRVVPVVEYVKIFVIVIIVKTTVLHFLLELISRMFLPTFKKNVPTRLHGSCFSLESRASKLVRYCHIPGG